MARNKYEIRKIRVGWALDIHWGKKTISFFFNRRNNAELVKVILEWEDDHLKPPLTPPNDPLTIEQLREMDGEPVWFDTIKRWGIVKVCRDGVFIITKSGEFEVDRCKYYRRPPEGET